MLRASVPEAPINKYCEPKLRENEIRFSEYSLLPPPSGNSMSPKEPRERNFGILICATTYAGHYLRTFGLGEDVSHGSYFHRFRFLV